MYTALSQENVLVHFNLHTLQSLEVGQWIGTSVGPREKALSWEKCHILLTSWENTKLKGHIKATYISPFLRFTFVGF